MKRIAYIIECMYNSGGMERVLSVCANALCRDFDITVITMRQGNQSFYFPLDKEVHYHDLDIKDFRDKTEIKQRLSEYLHKEHFDIVISLGGIDMYYLHRINDGSRKIIWFHFAIDIAKTTWAGPSPNMARKLIAQLQTWRRIYHAKKYDRIIVISKADHIAWKKYTNKVELIYNPITIDNPLKADLQPRSVISVGRLDYQKGYDFLITAWKLVEVNHPDWHLYIYGEGPLHKHLQQQIDKLQLSNVITLCGRVSIISEKYASRSIYVMSSRAEGLGLVLLEASACGLPLISYDCPSGPSEIIEDGVNGFLIKQVGDIDGMADAICKLIENIELRRQMGAKAKEMAERFSINNIKVQWVKLFNEVQL